jgi:hypothetical protein
MIGAKIIISKVRIKISVHLFSQVECPRTIRMLPIAPESFSQDWIVWFLQSFRFFVEAREVPPDYSFHSGESIIFQYSSEITTNL